MDMNTIEMNNEIEEEVNTTKKKSNELWKRLETSKNRLFVAIASMQGNK